MTRPVSPARRGSRITELGNAPTAERQIAVTTGERCVNVQPQTTVMVAGQGEKAVADSPMNSLPGAPRLGALL